MLSRMQVSRCCCDQPAPSPIKVYGQIANIRFEPFRLPGDPHQDTDTWDEGPPTGTNGQIGLGQIVCNWSSLDIGLPQGSTVSSASVLLTAGIIHPLSQPTWNEQFDATVAMSVVDTTATLGPWAYTRTTSRLNWSLADNQDPWPLSSAGQWTYVTVGVDITAMMNEVLSQAWWSDSVEKFLNLFIEDVYRLQAAAREFLEDVPAQPEDIRVWLQFTP